MARGFKENKYITNTILFLMVVGAISKLLPYILFFFIIYITANLLWRWLIK
jgi:hypothetical protein